jgi:hypothetical protein
MLFKLTSERFRTWGHSVWRARVGLAYCEAEVRAALRARRSAVLVLDKERGLMRVSTLTRSGAVSIPLLPLLAQMETLVTRTRKREPELWTGREWTRSPELSRT